MNPKSPSICRKKGTCLKAGLLLGSSARNPRKRRQLLKNRPSHQMGFYFRLTPVCINIYIYVFMYTHLYISIGRSETDIHLIQRSAATLAFFGWSFRWQLCERGYALQRPKAISWTFMLIARPDEICECSAWQHCAVFRPAAARACGGMLIHALLWKRGKDPRPQDFSLTKKTARFTKGQFRPENGLTTVIFVVKYTGKGLVEKRPGVLSKVQMLSFVLGLFVFSLLPIAALDLWRTLIPSLVMVDHGSWICAAISGSLVLDWRYYSCDCPLQRDCFHGGLYPEFPLFGGFCPELWGCSAIHCDTWKT